MNEPTVRELTRAAPDATGADGARAGPVTGTALLGVGAVLVWNDVAAEGRAQFYEWHDKEHIPERLAIPGFRRGRRFACYGHTPEWLTMYESDDLDVLVSPTYLARLNAPTPATTDTLRYFRNTSRAVCRIVHSTGSSSGGHVLALRLDVNGGGFEAGSEHLTLHLTREVLPRVAALTGVVACHLYTSDQQASRLDTAESSTRTFDVPSWVLLVEATNPDAAARAHGLVGDARLGEFGATVRADGAIYALEVCRLGQPA